MLRAHFDAVERALLAMGAIAANAGHPVHIGTPREWLLRSFLSQHLPSIFEIGTGEVISADSKPEDTRRQYDLVIHRQEHPRIDYGGGISAYLIEAVSATVEIKSTLTYEDFKKASTAARTLKQLRKAIGTGIAFGDPLPSPACFLVAYDGPAALKTVYDWIARLVKEEGFSFPKLPSEMNARVHTACAGIDAIFVLGRGFLYFDNAPMGWLPAAAREKDPDISWIWVDQNSGNLLYFFLLLNALISGFKYEQINPVEYLKGVAVPRLQWGK